MDIRMRRIFRPLARVAALLLERVNVSLRLLLSISILLALLGVASFYLLYDNPWSDDLLLLAMIFVFSNGILDEIIREFASLKEKKLSELEKVGLGIDGYMDVPVILAALYYLRTSEYDLGFLSFSLRIEDHAIIGAALLLGIYLVRYTSRQRSDSLGLASRAERAIYLTAFMVAGYTHERFPLYLLIGISSLGAILYLDSLQTTLRGYTKEHHLGYSMWRLTRPIKYLILDVFWGIKNAISSGLRLIRTSRETGAPMEIEEESKEKTEYPEEGHDFTALITDKNSSQPIVNAKVTLKNKETGKAKKATSNTAGKSDFSRVPEGQYLVTVEADGYKTEEFERFLSMDSGEVFALSRQSSDLSVMVTDGVTRMPIGGSLVILKSGEKEFRSKTDNLGVAYFKELKLGNYDVAVEASSYHPITDKLDLAKENLKAIELKRISEAELLEPSHAPKAEEPPPISISVQAEPSAISEAPTKIPEKERQIAQVIGESALIRYNAKSKLEKAISRIVDECISNDRQAFIVSTPPRTKIYRDKLRKAINSGAVKVVNLAPRDSPSQEANEVNMSNLRSFDSIFEQMPAGSVLIFEALSSLIIKEGGVVAYKFISDTIKHFSSEGLCIVCLLDSDAHSAEEISSFEKLFVNLVRLDGDKFELLN